MLLIVCTVWSLVYKNCKSLNAFLLSATVCYLSVGIRDLNTRGLCTSFGAMQQMQQVAKTYNSINLSFYMYTPIFRLFLKSFFILLESPFCLKRYHLVKSQHLNSFYINVSSIILSKLMPTTFKYISRTCVAYLSTCMIFGYSNRRCISSFLFVCAYFGLSVAQYYAELL